MKNKKKKKELNFKQRQAIIELIKPHKKTYTEIARNIGVDPRTLYYWRKQKAFSEAYEEAFNDLKKSGVIYRVSNSVTSTWRWEKLRSKNFKPSIYSQNTQ